MGPWSPALADPEARAAALSLEKWIALAEDATGEFVEVRGLRRAVLLATRTALGWLELFELHSGRYTRVFAAVDGTIADVPGCPGLAISLA